jgi:hypothetical protein
VHAVVSAFLFHRTDLMRDVEMLPTQGFTLQVLVALACAATAPAGLLVRRKEFLLLLALVLTAAACWLLVHNHTAAGLYGCSARA